MKEQQISKRAVDTSVLGIVTAIGSNVALVRTNPPSRAPQALTALVDAGYDPSIVGMEFEHGPHLLLWFPEDFDDEALGTIADALSARGVPACAYAARHEHGERHIHRYVREGHAFPQHPLGRIFVDGSVMDETSTRVDLWFFGAAADLELAQSLAAAVTPRCNRFEGPRGLEALEIRLVSARPLDEAHEVAQYLTNGGLEVIGAISPYPDEDTTEGESDED